MQAAELSQLRTDLAEASEELGGWRGGSIRLANHKHWREERRASNRISLLSNRASVAGESGSDVRPDVRPTARPPPQPTDGGESLDARLTSSRLSGCSEADAPITRSVTEGGRCAARPSLVCGDEAAVAAVASAAAAVGSPLGSPAPRNSSIRWGDRAATPGSPSGPTSPARGRQAGESRPPSCCGSAPAADAALQLGGGVAFADEVAGTVGGSSAAAEAVVGQTVVGPPHGPTSAGQRRREGVADSPSVDRRRRGSLLVSACP